MPQSGSAAVTIASCSIFGVNASTIPTSDVPYGDFRTKYPKARLLIEDKGSGTSLIQDLRADKVAVIGINPEGDKLTRAAKISDQFAARSVFFPRNAPWLSGLKAELLGFPNVKHDDQVDSVTQALSWIGLRRQNRIACVAPLIVSRPRTYFGDNPNCF